MLTYRGYRIEPFEPEPGRWRARISRLDGKKTKVAGRSQHPFIDTEDAVLAEETDQAGKADDRPLRDKLNLAVP